MTQIGSATHVGLVRDRNEDSCLVDESRGLFIVADGLGGHPAGDEASQVAVARLDRELTADQLVDRDVRDVLLDALQGSHEAVLEVGQEDTAKQGLGTTAVVAFIPNEGGTAWLAHVGDSRAYLIRGGELRQVTQDHSTGGPFGKGSLSQAIGTSGDINPDVVEVDIQNGDRVLLCTDGLTDMLDDEEIETFATGEGKPQEVVDSLVDAAIERGGVDNVTIVLVEI